jgi:hypothetical protein
MPVFFRDIYTVKDAEKTIPRNVGVGFLIDTASYTRRTEFRRLCNYIML